MGRLRRHWLRCVLTLSVALMLANCSALEVYNDIGDLTAQGDADEVVVKDVAYGPERRQKADIYVPAGNPSGAPVVVFFYGGKWSSGRKSDYAYVGEAFSRRGYVAMVADYRMVPTIRYPAFVQDSAKAVAFAYRNARSYGGDPDKLFIAGHSAGAYNAIMVALAPEFLRGEGLSTSVLKGAAVLSGPYDFLPLDNDITIEAFRYTVRDLRTTQPIYRVDPSIYTPPLLVMSGSDDVIVKPERHTKPMLEALARGGKVFEARTYPGKGHPGMVLALGGLLENRDAVLDDILDFFARHMPAATSPSAEGSTGVSVRYGSG